MPEPRRQPPVVITRPRAQAEPLAAQLAQLGIDARIFPLLEVQPLPAGSAQETALAAALARLTDYALVAFVSPNAIDAAFAQLGAGHRWPRSVIAAVVGDSSRQALARHGVTDANADVASPTDPERTDSETLLQVLDLPALAGKKALIVRAETGRELLADRLRDAGVIVEQVAAYRRGAPVLDQAQRTQLQALIDTDGGAVWVITSSEALRNLQQMVAQLDHEGAATTEGEDRPGGAGHLDGHKRIEQGSAAADDDRMNSSAWRRVLTHRLVVPHPRIAETAEAMGFDALLRTGSGDDALIAAIQAIQSRS